MSFEIKKVSNHQIQIYLKERLCLQIKGVCVIKVEGEQIQLVYKGTRINQKCLNEGFIYCDLENDQDYFQIEVNQSQQKTKTIGYMQILELNIFQNEYWTDFKFENIIIKHIDNSDKKDHKLLEQILFKNSVSSYQSIVFDRKRKDQDQINIFQLENHLLNNEKVVIEINFNALQNNQTFIEDFFIREYFKLKFIKSPGNIIRKQEQHNSYNQQSNFIQDFVIGILGQEEFLKKLSSLIDKLKSNKQIVFVFIVNEIQNFDQRNIFKYLNDQFNSYLMIEQKCNQLWFIKFHQQKQKELDKHQITIENTNWNKQQRLQDCFVNYLQRNYNKITIKSNIVNLYLINTHSKKIKRLTEQNHLEIFKLILPYQLLAFKIIYQNNNVINSLGVFLNSKENELCFNIPDIQLDESISKVEIYLRQQNKPLIKCQKETYFYKFNLKGKGFQSQRHKISK